jgi:hypothetical protein
MRQIFALTAITAVAVAQMSALGAQAVAIGIVTGTVNGTSGTLAAVTVQALNVSGVLAGSAVTTATGGFSITGLGAGTFTIQVVAANGAVIGASTATLVEGAMVATITVNATAAAVAAAATAATASVAGARAASAGAGAAAGAAAAAAAGTAMTTTAVVSAVGAAAGTLGTLGMTGPPEDLSGSR